MINVRQSLRDIAGFVRFVIRRWSEDRCPQIAGSLTYTTLLALVPLFAVVVAVLSYLPLFDEVIVQLKVFLLKNLVPEMSGRIITVYMAQFTESAGKLTAVSLVFLVVMAFSMLFTVDQSLNTIWRVRQGRPWWISMMAYVVLLLVGPLLMGFSVSVTTYLTALSAGIGGVPEEAQPVLLRFAPVLMSTLAFFLLYRIVPHRHVPWGHALAGGFLAAVLFEAMKTLFAWYVRLVPTFDAIYGAFSAIPVFLIWIYLSWLVILLGAEATASAGYWRGARFRHVPTPGSRFRDALRLGERLMQAGGHPVLFERLRREVDVPAEELEDALGYLVEQGIVRRTRREGYALAKPAEEVTFGDLYRAAVSPGTGVTPEEWTGVMPELARVAGELETQLKRPLTDLRK